MNAVSGLALIVYGAILIAWLQRYESDRQVGLETIDTRNLISNADFKSRSKREKIEPA